MSKDLIIFLCCLIGYALIILLPIFIYISRKKTKDVLNYLKLKNNWIRGVLAGSIVSIIYIFILVIKGKYNNELNIDLNIGIRWFYGFTVGFLEEIPMRGFLLNIFEEKFSFLISNIFTTLIFVSLHFPTWLIGGGNLVENSIRIFMMSFIFGYLVEEYDSLWPAIICHSAFNLSIWTGIA